MQITFDYQIFAGQEYGGISRYFIEMGNEFLKSRQDFKFVAPLYRNMYLKNAPELPTLGTYFPRLPYLGRATREANALMFKAYGLTNGNGLLHQTYFWEGNARAYWKGPVVITVYDMIHERYPEHFRANDPTVKQKRKAILAADHVICVAEHVRQDLLTILPIAKEKTSTIYLSHSPNSLTGSVDQLPSAIKGKYILYVGPRVGYKNFSSLLLAYGLEQNLQNDFQLVCVGGGAFTDSEKAEISKIKNGLERVVQVNGNDALLASLYARAEVFVYPSLAEGFGIPPIEAMALSCPVIAGLEGSFPEIVGSAGVLCDQKQPEELLKAMKSIVYDSKKRSELVEKGIQRAKNFSWERCARETLAVYKALGA